MITIMSQSISELFTGCRDRRFAPGETVFHTGDPILHVYLVREGSAALVRTLPSGDQAYLQRAGKGEVLAEASVYAERYHCDCVSLGPTVLAALSCAAFRQTLRKDADLAETWAAQLSRTVQRARMRAEIRSLRTVADRLDAWLAEYGQLPGKGQWQGVANELSVSREALYRELARRRR